MSHIRPDNMVSIQALANSCGVSRSTILRMEDEGLITPAYTDPDSGYRYYDVQNLGQVIRALNYQDLGFTKKEISAFIKNPDILKDNIEMLTERYNFILRELDRLSVLYSHDNNYLIRQQEFTGGYYMRLSASIKYSPRGTWRYAKESLEYFMTLGLTGITGKAMQIFVDNDTHPGLFDDQVHSCKLIIPIHEKSFGGEEVVYENHSLSFIISCNCDIDNTEPYFHLLREEALRKGHTPKGPIRIICFPEIVSYTKSEDNKYPMTLALMVE